VDTEHGERVEGGLDHFIERRAKKMKKEENETRPGSAYANQQEELWRKQEAARETQRQRDVWADKLTWHESQIRARRKSHSLAMTHHLAEAERYAELLGWHVDIDDDGRRQHD
jgi:hypothetical protein